MGITHVLRGEDLLLLDATPDRPVPALSEIGVGDGRVAALRPPAVRHGRGQPEAVQARPAVEPGPLPRARLPPRGPAQLPALLGWSIADDRDVFSLDEMVEAFDIAGVNANPARFDLKKAEAINADHIRALPVGELRRAPGAVPRRRRPDQRPTDAGAARAPRGGGPAGPGADQHLVRGASICWRSCSRPDDELRDRRGGSGETVDRRRAGRARPAAIRRTPRHFPIGRPRPDRAGPQRRARRRAGIETAQRPTDRLRVAITGSTVSPPLFRVDADVHEPERSGCSVSSLPLGWRRNSLAEATPAGTGWFSGSGSSRARNGPEA